MVAERPGPKFEYEVDLLIARGVQFSVVLIGLAGAGYLGINVVIEGLRAADDYSINGVIDTVKGGSDLLMSVASVGVAWIANRKIDNKIVRTFSRTPQHPSQEWSEDPRVQ